MRSLPGLKNCESFSCPEGYFTDFSNRNNFHWILSYNKSFPYKQVPCFTLHGCATGSRCFLPLADIFTVMFKREAVLAAKILVAVIAMERKVYPLFTEGTVLIDRRFFLPEIFRKERNDCCENSHRFVIAFTWLKTLNHRS